MAEIRKRPVERAIEHLENATLALALDGARFAKPGQFPLGPEAGAFTEEVKLAIRDYLDGLIGDEVAAAKALLDGEIARSTPAPAE